MRTANLELSQMRHLSPEPTVVTFFRLYRENRQAVYDLIVLLTLSIFTFLLLAMNNFTELFYTFTRAHEKYNLDEIILLTLVVLAIYLPIFAVRRWSESVQRLRQANTDSLTGIFNRRKGVNTLEMEIARANRYHRPLSIILFDVDHFKEINDRHGHLAGDQALKVITKTTQEKLRNVDIPVRWGGEEFMIISPETGHAEAHSLAERLRSEIEHASTRNNLRTTASFGVAQFKEGDSLNELILRADSKLYEAKSTGRNRVA